jgi:hypothetical protein
MAGPYLWAQSTPPPMPTPRPPQRHAAVGPNTPPPAITARAGAARAAAAAGAVAPRAGALAPRPGPALSDKPYKPCTTRAAPRPLPGANRGARPRALWTLFGDRRLGRGDRWEGELGLEGRGNARGEGHGAAAPAWQRTARCAWARRRAVGRARRRGPPLIRAARAAARSLVGKVPFRHSLPPRPVLNREAHALSPAAGACASPGRPLKRLRTS